MRFKAAGRKSDAKIAFKTAKSSREMLNLLKILEKTSEENELALEYWKLAQAILTEEGDPRDVLFYGKRALRIFVYNENANLPCFGDSHAPGIHGPPMFIAHVLQLLGFACHKLKRYHASLSYLNRSVMNLAKLEREGEDQACPDKCVMHSLHATELGLYRVKRDMGRLEEAARHMVRILRVKEKYMEEGSLGIGEACRSVYMVYVMNQQFKDARPFCERALEIYLKCCGGESVEVARIRKNLGEIYHAVGEHEKGLEQNQLGMGLLEGVEDSSELCDGETQRSCMLMHLGRNEEAIDLLRSVVSREDVVGPGRAIAYVHMAKVCCKLKKFADTRKYIRRASRILEKKDMKLMYAACGFAGLADVYEMMNDYETAITVTRKVLALPELPANILTQASDRLFQLIYRSGKVIPGIPYMKDAVGKITEKFGLEHYEVGYVHIKLAVAFKETDKLKSAVKHFIIAKDILDATIGPNHLQSLKTGQTLSITYAMMGRYRRATECQEEVVERLKRLGQSEEDFLKEAIRLLKEIKALARGADLRK